MRKLLYVLIALLPGAALKAQVVVSLQLPASGLLVKNQLWNLSLINTGIEEPNVKVEILLTDISNNQPVLSGVSRIFQLKKGVTQVSSAFASPVIYNVLSAGYGVDVNADGFLPIGVFNVCFRVIRVGEDTEQISEECETIEIEPVSPPVLLIPYDEEKIETTRPLFIWLPPAPHNLFYNILYDLKLVEVNQGQSTTSAIDQNLPVYAQSNISLTTQPYPGSYPGLETTKTYAWQITAKNNNSPVAKSEIWTFKVLSYIPSVDTSVYGEYYARMRRENDASYVISDGLLLFEFINELNVSTVDIRITDLSSSTRNAIALDSSFIAVKRGTNFLKLDMREVSLTDKHIYQLEVMNLNRERWFLKFEFRQRYNQ